MNIRTGFFLGAISAVLQPLGCLSADLQTLSSRLSGATAPQALVAERPTVIRKNAQGDF
ncbi:hypothetical protein TUM12370_10670 [Salmonella enterica subsp. enterica serovar Choleraesuis]|nr:hypothetical protein TUM12370_10670 [Salmonella enterica subsp. enterica serovar Choleraesuis]